MLTDRQVRAQEVRLRALLKKWRNKLWLSEWEINMDYYNGPISEEHFKAAAVTTVSWPYRRAGIQWNLEEVSKLTDEKLEWVFIHEAMHVIVNEMRDDKDNINHEERVCTTLATIIQGVWL